MTESRIQSDLAQVKGEIQRLSERLPVGPPTVHKDLSLISLVPTWSGPESAVTLEEFFASVETSGELGRWEENDQSEIAVLRLKGAAKLFYQGCTELHGEQKSWQAFKDAFRRRYTDVRTDQCHFTELQTAVQAKNERPQESADRCRALAHEVLGKSDDPQIQRVHQENAAACY
jgi:hypothetical protein